MDVIEKFSLRFSKEVVPLIKWEVDVAYLIFMVILAAKSADKDWHKKNLFYSYLRALLYVKGSDIILALCMGKSPMKVISSNETLFTVFLVWWLVLFVPFDIFNRVLYFEVGDVRPLVILLGLMTTLRQVLAASGGVNDSLRLYPGSYIAIFIGTLAGNGSLVVASVFGDFAKAISTHKMTTVAFVSALILTLSKLLCKKIVSASLALTGCVVLVLLLELLDAFGQKIEVFQPIYEFIRRVVVTCDLLNIDD